MALTTEKLNSSDEQICDGDSAETIEKNPKSWAAWKREAERLQAIIDEVANREAQPVAYTEQCEISNMQATGLYLRGFPNNSQGRNIPLYTDPPAPAVPGMND